MSKNKAQVNEGVLDDMDEDGWMAKSQLYQAAKYAIELHKMIQDTDNLEPWVQSKISKAADYLSSVKHYMEYESVNSYPGEATEEAPVIEAEECKYCGGDCPNDEENACDGYLGDIDNLYGTKTEEVVDEGMESDEVMAILAKHPQDVARMKQTGDINTASGLYTALYRYYSDEMPYGTQKARDGDPVEWIMDRLDDLGMMESQIDEGYESKVLAICQDAGIDCSFKNGKLHLDKSDMAKARELLDGAEDIIELPDMVAETNIGSDTDDLWMEKMAAAGLKSATEGRMSEISAAADEVSSMIENGATDEEIIAHTGLKAGQVKFLRNQLSDRPQQYEGNYASKLPKGHKNYKAQQAAVAISKQGG